MDPTKKFLTYMQPVAPGVSLAPKKDSRLMRIIATILFFNKDFMEGYITTLGTTIYVNLDFMSLPLRRQLPTLAHECVHARDYLRGRWGFVLGYLYPQVLAAGALGALGAIWGSWWWLLCLAFLVFLWPWPAPWRTESEVRGYAMSAVVNMWIVGAEPGGEYYEHLVEAYSEQFTSMNYYRMCPDGDFVENELRKQITSAYHGKHADPIFRHVKQFLHRDGFLKKKSL